MRYSHIVKITNRMSSTVRINAMKSKQTRQTSAWKNRKSDLFAIHRFFAIMSSIVKVRNKTCFMHETAQQRDEKKQTR